MRLGLWAARASAAHPCCPSQGRPLGLVRSRPVSAGAWPGTPASNIVDNEHQYMRENWISNRIFSSYGDILDHCCAAWNKLTDQPWLIMPSGLRNWAHRF